MRNLIFLMLILCSQDGIAMGNDDFNVIIVYSEELEQVLNEKTDEGWEVKNIAYSENVSQFGMRGRPYYEVTLYKQNESKAGR